VKKYAMIPANELSTMFYALECLGYPPITRIHFELRGANVDMELLRRSYLLGVKQYPLFNATLHDLSSWCTWQLCWVPRKDVCPERAVRSYNLAHLSHQEAEAKFAKIQFDPFSTHCSSKDPPFWMALCRMPDGHHKLLAFFHHAVSDGHGYHMFLQYIFETYNRLDSERMPDKIHHDRPVFGPTTLLAPTLPVRIRHFLQAVCILAVKAIAQKGRRTAHLLAGRGPLTSRTSAVQRSIGPEKMQRYIDAARKLGATFTSFYSAAQVLALQRWKKARCEPCGPITVQLLKDLRETKKSLREVQNNFSAYSIMIPEKQISDSLGLVRFISRQSHKSIKDETPKRAAGLLWLLNFSIVKKLLPVWGNTVFNSPGFGDSFQISNTGRLWAGPNGETLLTRLGDAEIAEFYMAVGPPIPTMGTYTGLCTFRGTLFLSFNYFTWALSKRDANAFVDLIEEVLDEIADCTAQTIAQRPEDHSASRVHIEAFPMTRTMPLRHQ
jgi:hypothetical protein